MPNILLILTCVPRPSQLSETKAASCCDDVGSGMNASMRSHPPGAGAFCLQNGFVDESSLQDPDTEMTSFRESVTVPRILVPLFLHLGVCCRSSGFIKWVNLVL
jgi:hypothetical protein